MSATDQPVHSADPSDPIVIVADEPLSVRMLRMLVRDTSIEQLVVVMRPDQALPIEALSPEVHACVSASVVTDAVKHVNASGLIVGSVDRASLRSVDLPVVVRATTLLDLLADADADERVDVVDTICRASGSLTVVGFER